MRRRSSTVELLICNQVVGGSIPFVGSILLRSNRGPKCRSIRASEDALRSFEPPEFFLARSEGGQETEHGGVPERPKGADCKSAGIAYGGSNPPPSTILLRSSPASGARGLELRRMPSEAKSNPGLGRREAKEAVFLRAAVGSRIFCANGIDAFQFSIYTRKVRERAGVTQLAESQPSKLLVAGSIPVARSILLRSNRSPEFRAIRASEEAVRSSEASGFLPGRGAKEGIDRIAYAHVAQSAEHVLGKDGVSSSILLVGSILANTIFPGGARSHVQAEI